MKQFTTIKVGYSAGVYGCSGEYFTTTIINGEENRSVSFQGMYGAEERVNAVLKELGFKEFYTPSRYGQLKGEERKGFLSETQAIEWIKSGMSYENYPRIK